MKTDLKQRMRAYRESANADARRSGVNWTAFAAAAGSALAMASNASANTIVYSGIQNVTAGPLMTAAPPGFSNQSRMPFNTSAHANFFVDGLKVLEGVHQSGTWSFGSAARLIEATASIKPAVAGLSFRVNGAGQLRDFASGALLGDEGTGWSAGKVKLNHFPANGVGFAEFRFNDGPGTDFGWLKLQYFNGIDGGADQIKAISWAYAGPTGNGLITIYGTQLNAGQTTNSYTYTAPGGTAPEPSTDAMALLAAGAAGLMAWRKRRVSHA